MLQALGWKKGTQAKAFEKKTKLAKSKIKIFFQKF
jgi:hypothetical protein